MQMGVRERDGAREGGIERLGWCLGLISLLVIIVASCWMLDTWAASASGQQLSSAQHSTARQSKSRQQISTRRSTRAQSPIWLEAFSPACAVATHDCYRTPRMAAEVRRCMYM